MQRWRAALLLAWTLFAALPCSQGSCVLDSSEAIRALPFSVNQNNGQDVTTILTQPCQGPARGISVPVPGATWTLTARDAGALDLRWAKDALIGGQRVALESVNVSRAVLRASPLGLFAFNASSLRVIGSTIETDCQSLSLFKGKLSPENGFWVSGPQFLYVANYTTSSLQMDTTNLTCAAKTVTRSESGGAAVEANDTVSLLNALVWSQEADRSGPFEIRVPTNISWDTSWWAEQFTVVKNVTISAPTRGLTVLDLQGATSAVNIAPGAYLTLNNFALMNVGPLRGTIANLGMLPLFAVPVSVPVLLTCTTCKHSRTCVGTVLVHTCIRIRPFRRYRM